jgi:nicotinamidase-related amidase
MQRCRELAIAFRRRGEPVIWIRTERPGVMEQPPGSELAPGLAAPGDVLLVKHSIGAFATTDLEARLKADGITTIVFGGISTTLGVESTARAAGDHGYHVEFVQDAMTDFAAEDHRWAVERVFPRLGVVRRARDYLRAE